MANVIIAVGFSLMSLFAAVGSAYGFDGGDWGFGFFSAFCAAVFAFGAYVLLAQSAWI